MPGVHTEFAALARAKPGPATERQDMKRKLLRVIAGAVALAGVASGLLAGNAHAATLVQVRIEALNGLCLGDTNAGTGFTPLLTTDCAHAHAFTWDQTHDNIYVQGHPGQCLAEESPGFIIIDACSGGNSVLGFGAIVDGTFQQIYFKNYANSYWRAEASGDAVLLGSAGTSTAYYWDFIPLS